MGGVAYRGRRGRGNIVDVRYFTVLRFGVHVIQYFKSTETNLFPISMSTYKLVTVHVDLWSNTLIVYVM